LYLKGDAVSHCASVISSTGATTNALLAGQPHGCTEADMLTHGFELAMLSDLIFAGFALAVPRDTLTVMWIEITEAGRQAIAD
jgi:hypothetical protein